MTDFLSLATHPQPRILQCRNYTLPLGPRTLIMGVLNLTPDSFSDGGKFQDPQKAVDQAEQMVGEGADIIDVGGESTRPGAQYVDEKEEIARIRPFFEIFGRRATIPLSIDTRKSCVAEIALDLGASIVNDVSALRDDPEMAQTVRQAGAGVVLMHRKNHSAVMQQDPRYANVIQDVRQFLRDRVNNARQHGIHLDRIILDPGIGFGKTQKDNFGLLANLDQLLNVGFPVLVGASRKAFLGELTGQEVMRREMGHAAVVAMAVWQGCHIVRVHDVKAMKDVVQVAQALRNSVEPSSRNSPM